MNSICRSPDQSEPDLVEVLCRRHARGETALRQAFDEFVDGYRSVVGAVRDLIDAGFEPGHLPALVERLEERQDGSTAKGETSETRRVRAVLSVASAVAEDLAKREAGGRAELLRRARDAFQADPDELLPTRALFIHGFADATGRATAELDAGDVLVVETPGGGGWGAAS